MARQDSTASEPRDGADVRPRDGADVRPERGDSIAGEAGASAAGGRRGERSTRATEALRGLRENPAVSRVRESPAVSRMLETRTQTWQEVGLARQLSRQAIKRARVQLVVLTPVLAAILLVFFYRDAIFGPAWDTPVRIIVVLALLMVGWQFARDAGRAFGPTVLRRMDPGTAGSVGFLIRLTTMLVAVVVALRLSGIQPRTLALGGAFTAVVVGLAAQQTLGNLIAGTVLLSVRPFRVGDRVRLQAGGLAGTTEGIVSSLGLLYTTLAHGEDAIMVPNSVVLSSAVVPLREPSGVDLRARLRPGVTPLDIQNLLAETITTPTRDSPRIILEEIDGDEVVVRIEATPERAADGPRLASEVLDAVGRETARSGPDT